MKKFDVIVIGAGTGLEIVSFAAGRGMKVALIEEGVMGGTCLNRGCIPSKMLIHAADVAETIKSAGKFGISAKIDSVDLASLVKRVSETVDDDSKNIEESLREDNNVTIYKTRGKFVGDKTLEVAGETIVGDKIFIVAGTRPDVPPISGIESVPYLTSTEALRLTTLPETLVIIGGGYIAAELAHFFGSLGSTVHIINRGPKLVANEDSEIAEWFTGEFSKKHKVHLNAEIVGVRKEGSTVVVQIKNADGKTEDIAGNKLLMATGRKSNADILNVSDSGIKVSERGLIKVNDFLETSVKGVWALGDIVGILSLKHTANHQVGYVIRNAFLGEHEPVDYSAIGHAMFSSPQVAGVGKTEDELKKTNTPYRVGKYEYKNTGMGGALQENGLVKVLLAKDDDTILGCHIIGKDASTLIHEVIVAMKATGKASAITNAVHIHPALSEVIQKAFYSVE